VVVAFSFTPEPVSRQLEHKVPALDKRIAAMRELADRGWRIGLRFDPVIYEPGFEKHYDELFAGIFSRVDSGSIHSATLGAFRMPREFHRRIATIYPDEPLYAMPLAEHDGLLGYPARIESRMLDYCRARLNDYLPAEKLFDHEIHPDTRQAVTR
jgi:spore photoproduct lyase